MYCTWMRDRHIGPKDKELIRKGEKASRKIALTVDRIVRVNTQEVHMMGRSNRFKIAHRRLKPAKAYQMLGSVGCQRTR